MRKINFVKEIYIGDELEQIWVNYTDEYGTTGTGYTPDKLPKYIKNFMSKRNKELFTTEYDKKQFNVTTYIYRK